MRTTLLLSAVLLASPISTFAAGPPKEDAGKADAAKLQGTWQVIKFVDHSEEAAPEEEIKNMTFVFKGDNLGIFKDKGGSGHEMQFTLDASKKPKAIDLKPGIARVDMGISKLDGDELTFCVIGSRRSDQVSVRPSEFKASKSGGYSLFVLKKVKETKN